jgi:hypothetical protein
LLNAAVLILGLVGWYTLVVRLPHPTAAHEAAWAAALVCIAGRRAVELLAWSSQTALFQRMRAGANDDADGPLPIWGEAGTRV